MSAVDPSLPGAELVVAGLADLRKGVESDEALLVALASHRLGSMGLEVPRWRGPEPEMRLYERLYERLGDGAHSAYNALLRRLIRFEHALEADRARTVR